MEDYYDQFLQICAIFSQQANDIYFREIFWSGLHTKLKVAIIGMPWRTLAEVANFAIKIEEEMSMKMKWHMVKHHQDSNIINESEDDYEDKYYWRTMECKRKVKFDTYRKGIIINIVAIKVIWLKNVNSY